MVDDSKESTVINTIEFLPIPVDELGPGDLAGGMTTNRSATFFNMPQTGEKLVFEVPAEGKIFHLDPPLLDRAMFKAHLRMYGRQTADSFFTLGPFFVEGKNGKATIKIEQQGPPAIIFSFCCV